MLVPHLDDDGGHVVEAGSGGSWWAQSSIWHLASAGVATLEFEDYFVISRKSADVDKSVKIVENSLSLVISSIPSCSSSVRKRVSRMFIHSRIIHRGTDSCSVDAIFTESVVA